MQYLVYKDNAGEFRWKLQADNGKTIAVSSEGYKRKADCLYSIQLIKNSCSTTTPVVEIKTVTGPKPAKILPDQLASGGPLDTPPPYQPAPGNATTHNSPDFVEVPVAQTPPPEPPASIPIPPPPTPLPPLPKPLDPKSL